MKKPRDPKSKLRLLNQFIKFTESFATYDFTFLGKEGALRVLISFSGAQKFLKRNEIIAKVIAHFHIFALLVEV